METNEAGQNATTQLQTATALLVQNQAALSDQMAASKPYHIEKERRHLDYIKESQSSNGQSGDRVRRYQLHSE